MRLFIALPVPEEVRGRIIARTKVLREKYPELKWVRGEALHLTMSFLGETEEGRVDQIRSIMDKAASGVDAFEMELGGIGFFPKKGPPRVLYTAVTKGAPETRTLYSALLEGLEKIGFEGRKKFTPHLTLARVKGKVDTPDPEVDGTDIDFSFTADRLVLYRSRLTPSGAVYETLGEAKL
ncbi:MAG: RNA 2',3'-cyclic phosphodiesterase [Spirochaetaceae bacterium]